MEDLSLKDKLAQQQRALAALLTQHAPATAGEWVSEWVSDCVRERKEYVCDGIYIMLGKAGLSEWVSEWVRAWVTVTSLHHTQHPPHTTHYTHITPLTFTWCTGKPSSKGQKKTHEDSRPSGSSNSTRTPPHHAGAGKSPQQQAALHHSSDKFAKTTMSSFSASATATTATTATAMGQTFYQDRLSERWGVKLWWWRTPLCRPLDNNISCTSYEYIIYVYRIDYEEMLRQANLDHEVALRKQENEVIRLKNRLIEQVGNIYNPT